MKRWFVGLAAILMLSNASAETLSLNYEGFYDRMKVLNDEDYSLVDMQFMLVTEREGKPCPVTEGLLLTESTEQNILIKEDNKQIFLPFDKQLDSDKAILTFKIPGPTRCTLSMQVTSSLALATEISTVKLREVRNQFDDLYDDLAGIFVSWLLPDVKGVIMDFDEAVDLTGEYSNTSIVKCEKSRCFIDLSDTATLPEKLVFPTKPTVIRPWIVK